MRLLGSLAVLAEVSFFFIPVILAQKDFFLPASFLVLGFGAGGFKPGFPGLAALEEALPFAFRPPLGFFPSFLVHAALILAKPPPKLVLDRPLPFLLQGCTCRKHG